MNETSKQIAGGGTLFYDGECYLCRNLAAWVERRSHGAIQSLPWPIDETLDAEIAARTNDIGFRKGDQVLYGRDAWQTLLSEHPDMQSLDWLAQKLGISSALTSLVSSAAHAVKRLCISCKSRR
jgi:predicted DCC family thiol-disulfide oxidoreductase YuxK